MPDVLVLLSAITDLTTRWGERLGGSAEKFSPLQHISRSTPPTLLIHGDADTVVDISHARAFHQRMLELGNQSRLVEVPGPTMPSPFSALVPPRAISWPLSGINRFLRSLGYLTGAPIPLK